MFIFGTVLGILIGSMVGIVIMALMISSKDRDIKHMEDYMIESSNEIVPEINKDKK